MATVIGVKFKQTGKMYYFSPKNIEFSMDDGVITETVRGLEYGIVCMENKEIEDDKITAPLKEVVRKATEEDTTTNRENIAKRDYLMRTAKEKSQKFKLNMKIVDAEYTFDRQKVIIYFTADGRVDFRDLVKELAGIFHVRIELRQIYERDNIKMQGALAICGRPCCCTTFLNDFDKVGIKMAKIQGLSLNPQKISGCCGKLMCCLKYEYEYYDEVSKIMPKIGSTAYCVDGEGTVIQHDLLRKEVKMKILLEDGSYDIRSYKLDDIDTKVKKDFKKKQKDTQNMPQEQRSNNNTRQNKNDALNSDINSDLTEKDNQEKNRDN